MALVDDLLKVRESELPELTRIDDYLRGRHDSVYVPRAARQEFRWIVQRARVNVLPLVVDTIAQSLYVDGFRTPTATEDSAGWATWQANRMDARQTGIHRAALSFGASYLLIEPGDTAPVWTPRTPLTCTAVYDDPATDEWPVAALLRDGARRFRLIDATTIYDYEITEQGNKAKLVGQVGHDIGLVPVVRFLNTYDPDGRVTGEVGPLIPLQDQINFTTYGLLMAQQFAAFRQRWVTGMVVPEDAEGRPIEPFDAAVNRLFIGDSPDTRFGEFDQTDLSGYLASRESTMRNLATIAQVPPHHLIGTMANLSAEALAAAEVQQQRKIAERKAIFGESYEQAFRLSARISGDAEGAADIVSQVVWRDTEARSMSQTADALGKLAEMLQVPVEMLWEKIPGWTQTDVERARALREDTDSLGQLTALLTGQATEVEAVDGVDG